MGRQSPSRLSFVFGATALLVIGGVVASFAFLYLPSLRSQAERNAATVAARSLAPVLEAGGPEAFTVNAERILGDQVSAIRLFLPTGELLAVASDGAPAEPRLSAIETGASKLASFKSTSSKGAVLVSYTPFGNGTVLEIQQDYGPIGSSIASLQRNLFLVTGSAGAVVAVLVLGFLWVDIHGLSAEHKRLLYLYRTGQAIRSTLDLTDVLEQLSRDAAVFAQAKLAVAAIVEEHSNDLIVMASYDREADSTAQHRRNVEEWYLRRCAGTGETLQAQERSLPYATLLGYEPERQGPVNVLCAAIPGRERAIGVLMVVRELHSGKFPSSEVQMVEEMAAQAAMAVEQAILFAKVRGHADELELSYDSTLKVLVAALDTKDSITHGHSERVAKLTISLAREIGVPNERLLDIERGALLHDVGKIGVPDQVLQKPAELDEGEWEAMRKHPLLAGLMISKVGFLEGALPILLYHHERYDGTGYPFGLEGSAIPLEARIFTVVDSYDAMTSDRPYRKAMPQAAALEEIQRNAGIQFDPDVVKAFARLMARNPEPIEEAA
jgi:HD-GYP domain-containing protein (c-di-GMP phosphodiesterase class II)